MSGIRGSKKPVTLKKREGEEIKGKWRRDLSTQGCEGVRDVLWRDV